MTYEVIREISKEDWPWLDSDIPEGSKLYRYYGHTYGCISFSGMAETWEKDKEPFFEVPIACIRRLQDEST